MAQFHTRIRADFSKDIFAHYASEAKKEAFQHFTEELSSWAIEHIDVIACDDTETFWEQWAMPTRLHLNPEPMDVYIRVTYRPDIFEDVSQDCYLSLSLLEYFHGSVYQAFVYRTGLSSDHIWSFSKYNTYRHNGEDYVLIDDVEQEGEEEERPNR